MIYTFFFKFSFLPKRFKFIRTRNLSYLTEFTMQRYICGATIETKLFTKIAACLVYKQCNRNYIDMTHCTLF